MHTLIRLSLPAEAVEAHGFCIQYLAQLHLVNENKAYSSRCKQIQETQFWAFHILQCVLFTRMNQSSLLYTTLPIRPLHILV